MFKMNFIMNKLRINSSTSDNIKYKLVPIIIDKEKEAISSLKKMSIDKAKRIYFAR